MKMPERAVTAGQATVHLGRDGKALEKTSQHLPVADTGLTFQLHMQENARRCTK